MRKFLRMFIAGVCTATALDANAQDTKIRFFGQPELVQSQVNEKNHLSGIDGSGHYVKKDTSYADSNFNSGNFVLFVTSQLSERVSVLAEASANNNGTATSFDVQRLFLKYYVRDYFSVRVGKMFTPLGYWNNQFTLGLVLQPTIQRPFIIRTSNDGGVLQYRDVGMQFEGENISKARLFYKVLIGNGIGFHGSNDKGDTHVAVTAQIGAEPVEGLKIIATVQSDRIEGNKPNSSGSGYVVPDGGKLYLYLLSLAYMNPEKKPEFIFEASDQRDNFNNLGKKKSTGYFAYGGYKVTPALTPYVLYSHNFAGNNKTDGDPYIIGIPAMINNLSIGARYKLSSSFVFKLEYEYTAASLFFQDIVAGGVTLDKGFTDKTITKAVRAQFAFVF